MLLFKYIYKKKASFLQSSVSHDPTVYGNIPFCIPWWLYNF